MKLDSRTVARLSIALALLAAISDDDATGAPPPTGFTYQGRIESAGLPQNGPANMVFRLFDAPSGGTLLGTSTQPGVQVASGTFTVSLSYPASAYNSQRALFVEVEVNGTTLSPRHAVSAVPYSLSTRGISVDPAGKVALGHSTPDALLDIRAGGLLQHDDAGQGISFATGSFRVGNFPEDETVYQYLRQTDQHQFLIESVPKLTIDRHGASVTGRFSALDAAGEGISLTTPHLQLFDGAMEEMYRFWNLDGKHVFSTSGTARMVIDSQGRVGIGTGAPAATLHVAGAPGDASVILPDSSIGALEIADEPGVCSGRPAAFPINLTGSDSILVTQTITCPAAGYVVVMADIALQMHLSTAYGAVLIDGAPAASALLQHNETQAGREAMPMHGCRPITAGVHTITFKASCSNAANGYSTVNDARVTAMYFPTSYGLVMP